MSPLLAYGNKADAATLAGGAWTAGLPRANLQDERLAKAARTSDAALASTRFRADLGTTYVLRALNITRHNCSTTAMWRVRAGNAPLDLLFDQEAVDERITCSGGVNGTRFNSAGVMVAAVCPRIDYDPVTLAARGLRVEEARTNLFLNSLLNGTNLSTQAVTLSAVTHTISFYGTGTVTLTGASTAGPLVGTGAMNKVALSFTPSAGAVTFTVTGTVKWANLEVGSSDTSFIPTAGAAVTRTADAPIMTGSNFSSWYNSSEGTFCAQATPNATSQGRILQCDDGSYANYLILERSAGPTDQIEVGSGGGPVAGTTGGVPAVGVARKNAVAYKVNDFQLAYQGVLAAPDTSGAVPVGLTRMAIGYDAAAGALQFNGWIYRLTYFPTRQSDAVLQTITGASGPDALGINTGWVSVLQFTFQGAVPGDWGTKYALGVTFASTIARYLTVEIQDTANTAGYVQLGRLFVADGFQPAKGPSYGLQSGREDLSTVTTAISGVRYATERRRPRTEKFTLQYATQAEADRIHEMQDEVGTVGEVLYVPDTTDAGYSQRYGFLGHLEQLGPLDYPVPLRRSIAFAMKEKL